MTCLNDYLAINLDTAKVFHGSNLDVLPLMADNSVDAIVTDPPYELGFMGKTWDSSGIAYSVELWRECLRVLKPGGHLLSFGGTRTWHRVAVAIEDAGFEVRDSIAWLYGSGFPKSLDISKAIDKAAGAEREVIGSKIASSKGIKVAELRSDTAAGSYGGEAKEIDITAPATPEAKEWAGWGTALKPAFEPIVVARKPLIGTVAANVLEWGTGGLNIDGNRIGTGETKTVNYPDIRGGNYGQDGEAYADRATVSREIIDKGRWPANIILDEYTAGLVDEQSGHLTSGALKAGRKVAHTNVDFMQGLDFHTYESPANSGGASRFFYIAKASRRDRNEGLEALDKEKSGAVYNERLSGGLNAHLHGEDSKPQKNFHPTVKPTTLMEYLIKLVTPPGGTVLDPFTGSGSTGKAALLNGFEFIGIELTADYLPIIEGRLTHAQNTKNEGLF